MPHTDSFHTLLQESGAFAPLLYIAFKALANVFAPFSAGPIQVLSGTLFGFLPALIYTVIADMLGGSLNFWIARYFGRAFMRRLIGEQGMKRVEALTEKTLGGWGSLMRARLFLFSVWDFMSYAIGLSATPYRTYFIISLTVGSLPTALMVGFGAAFADLGAWFMVIYGIVLVASLLPILWKARSQNVEPPIEPLPDAPPTNETSA